MVTCVALVAATVNVDALPVLIVVGLALIVTVAGVTGAAATVTTVVAVACPFLPDAVAV
jgi:hypothetical protein